MTRFADDNCVYKLEQKPLQVFASKTENLLKIGSTEKTLNVDNCEVLTFEIAKLLPHLLHTENQVYVKPKVIT